MLSRAFGIKVTRPLASTTATVARVGSLATRQTAAARRLPLTTTMAVRFQHSSKPAAVAHKALKPLDSFPRRHIGPDSKEQQAMLKQIGLDDIDALLAKAIPPSIRSPKALALQEGITERELLQRLKSIASKNKVFRSFMGMGYTDTVVPNVILRNVLENPAWYTQVNIQKQTCAIDCL